MAGQERGWLAANRQTWCRVAHGASTCQVVGMKEGPLEARQTMLFMLLSQKGMEEHTSPRHPKTEGKFVLHSFLYSFIILIYHRFGHSNRVLQHD